MEESKKAVSFWSQLLEKNQTFIFRSAVLNLCIFGYSFLFGWVNPSAGEAWAYNITLICGILNALFVGTVAASGLGISVFFSSLVFGWSIRHARIQITGEDEPPMLPENSEGDMLFIQSLNQSPADNVARFRRMQEGLKEGCYIAALKYQYPLVAFSDGLRSWAANRSEFEGVEVDYSKETPKEFEQYSQLLRSKFSNYCASRKTEKGASAIESLMKGFQTVANIALLLLIPICAFSQKTEMVKNALGATANATPREGAKVIFVFENGSIERTANGSKSIAELITHNRPSTVDANDKGAFIGCSVDGIAVAQVAAVNKQTQADKPKALFADVTPPVNIALPDSVTAQRQLDSADEALIKAKTDAERYFIQVFLSDSFVFASKICMLLFLVFRFISNTAMNESRVNSFGQTMYGGWALNVSRCITFITWCLGIIVFLPPLSMVMYHILDLNFGYAIGIIFKAKYIAFLIALAASYAFERFFDKLIKEPKVGGGNRGGGMQPYN